MEETIIEEPPRKYARRGFGGMSREKNRAIASRGGKAAHALGRAHKWTPEEAQEAGRIGGSISRRHGPSKKSA